MILVMGCGFLGSCIVENLVEKNPDEQIIATVRDESNKPCISSANFINIDINSDSDLEKLKAICDSKPLKVVYLSAVHNIDFVYKNPAIAAETNLVALKKFLNMFDTIERIIFASTDCVYGDKPYPFLFKETDELNPVNEYGRQKAEAEKTVLSHGGCVVRLPLMIGSSPTPKKGFFDNCCEKLLNGQKIDMLDGYLRSALSFKDAADIIARLLLSEKEIPQILNVCSDDVLSKYDIGCKIADYLKLSHGLVNMIPEENGDRFYIEKRAKSALMNNELLKSFLGVERVDFRIR